MPAAATNSEIDSHIAAVRAGAVERFQELIAACEPQVRAIAALVTGRADVPMMWCRRPSSSSISS
jgi:hypothetical protein